MEADSLISHQMTPTSNSSIPLMTPPTCAATPILGLVITGTTAPVSKPNPKINIPCQSNRRFASAGVKIYPPSLNSFLT